MALSRMWRQRGASVGGLIDVRSNEYWEQAPDELVGRLDIELVAFRLEQLCEDGFHHGAL